MAETEQTEFFCKHCEGHIRLEFDKTYHKVVTITCPCCGARHIKKIEKGKIVADSMSYSDFAVMPSLDDYCVDPWRII